MLEGALEMAADAGFLLMPTPGMGGLVTLVGRVLRYDPEGPDEAIACGVLRILAADEP